MSPTRGRLAADSPRESLHSIGKSVGYSNDRAGCLTSTVLSRSGGPTILPIQKRAKGSRLGRGLPFLCFPAAQRSGQTRDSRHGRCTLVGPKSEHVGPKSKVLASRLPIADLASVREEMKTAARDDMVKIARSLARTRNQAMAIAARLFKAAGKACRAALTFVKNPWL